MNNPDNMKVRDFVWRDSYSKEDKTYHNEKEVASENYSYQIHEMGNRIYRKLFSRILIISAVWFLVLIIFLIVVFSRRQDVAEKKQILVIEKRLDRLESDFTLLTTDFALKLDRAIKEMERERLNVVTGKAPLTKKPLSKQEEQKDVKSKIHKVQTGDTLSRISRYYGLSIEQLRDFNNLEPNDIIYPGQELKLTP